MPSGHGIDDRVYEVGGGRVSMRDLLHRFSEDQFQLDGVWRLSDLHLKVGEPASYRFDNELTPLSGAVALTEATLERLLFPLLTAPQIARLRNDPPADVDAGFDLPEERLSFRINAFRDRDGLACAIRVLPRSVPRVEDVGFPADEIWQEIVRMRQGLVVVTGITGSGKSTTVASLIRHVNEHRPVRIITLEDPIEYVLVGERGVISQRELGKHIASFHQGLRSALREDPDVIFIGEMRDRETTALALSAAETGHLVLSTLHTKDAKGAVTRIVDMFPQERTKEICSQLSFSLSFVLAQKLVPRAGGKGRRVAMEVLKNTAAVANLVRTGRWHQIYSVMESDRKSGQITLERHLRDLVARGEIAPEEARRFANDPSMLV